MLLAQLAPRWAASALTTMALTAAPRPASRAAAGFIALTATALTAAARCVNALPDFLALFDAGPAGRGWKLPS